MNPTVLVLVGLGVLWAIVLAPEAVSFFRKASTGSKVSRGGIGPVGRNAVRTSHSTRPMPSSMATTTLPYQGQLSSSMSRRDAARRRAMLLFALVVMSIVTLGLAIVSGGVFVFLNLMFILALGGYFVLLNQRAGQAATRTAAPRQVAGAGAYHNVSPMRPRQAPEAAYAYAGDYDAYDDYEDDYAQPLRRSVGY